jgi:hypothetical protein
MNGFLERTYQSDSTGSPITCMLHGMGGVGKTATALEYAYLNRDEYDSIFWIAADSHSRFLQSYSAMGELVGVVSEAEAVRDWLKTTRMFQQNYFHSFRRRDLSANKEQRRDGSWYSMM